VARKKLKTDYLCNSCGQPVHATATCWADEFDSIQIHIEPCKRCLEVEHLEGEMHRDKVISKEKAKEEK